MKITIFSSVISILIILYLFEKNHLNTKKEKRVFFSLLIISAILTSIVVFFPNVPGPSQWVEAMINFLFK